MAKLTALRSRLSAPMPRVGRVEGDRQGYDRERARREYRKWYNTAEWRAMRLRVFTRDLFTCQCGCGTIEGNTSLLVADHRVPHRGDRKLFFDERNVWTLLKRCHDSWKQKQERAEG